MKKPSDSLKKSIELADQALALDPVYSDARRLLDRLYASQEAQQGIQPIHPMPPKRPKFLYYSGPNPLRRWPNARTIRDSLWKELDTIVTCDFRMSTSGMWSDYILPACGYYEKPGIKYTMSYIPYVVVGDRAVPPLYESRHEWDIMIHLARKIQERARARGVKGFTDHLGEEHYLKPLGQTERFMLQITLVKNATSNCWDKLKGLT